MKLVELLNNHTSLWIFPQISNAETRLKVHAHLSTLKLQQFLMLKIGTIFNIEDATFAHQISFGAETALKFHSFRVDL